jgi:hypothetical protein
VLSNDGLEPLPETFPLILALGKLVGGGELYEAYEALFDGRPVVAKLSDLTQFPTSLYSDHTEESALAALVMEEAIYTTTLRSFAGCVVPRDYGLFATGTIYCRIEENVGRMLTEEEKLHPEVM